MAQGIRTDTIELHSSTRGPIAATVVRPDLDTPLPLCLFLYGGGGSHELLRDLAPMLAAQFRDGLPPMTFACLDAPPWGFYLDGWETVLADEFPRLLRERYRLSEQTSLVGISMGGHAALRIALSRPREFGAVAAVSPMIEPSLSADGSPLRNRFHYPPQCPPALVGDHRDPELYRSHHPAQRAIEHADALRSFAPAIWFDAASRDVLHAHDGAEFLHRILWDLDVPHEYVLRRDANHVGPTIVPRLAEAFAWVGRHLVGGTPRPSPEEEGLQAALREASQRAEGADPTFARTYGVLSS